MGGRGEGADMARALKIVDDEPAETPPVSGVAAAAASGSRLELLLALRAQIAAELEAGVPPRDLASLSLRLVNIAEQIEQLQGDGEDEVTDAAEAPDEAWPAS
jgi:hypothetical protein